MAKKKKKAEEPGMADVISSLLELAEECKPPDGFLENEIEDASEDERQLIVENLNSGTLMEKLEFLYLHGYRKDRLEELIRQIEV